MTDINFQRAALQLLRDCQSAGLTHLPPPSESLAVPAPSEVLQAAPETIPENVHEQDISNETLEAVVNTTPENTLPPENRVAALAALSASVSQCERCQELAETRTQAVFGVGNPDAKVMFIGEAPGADEDKQGEPFVGRAGQLLTKIIEACGWTREEIYICNILRCRPPDNRNPTDEEANNCREYLDGQISIIEPDYIVCWGSVAAKNLLNQETPIGRMRGKFFEYGRAKVICTYHPSYLLRNPAAKKPVWEDMKLLLNDMGLTPP